MPKQDSNKYKITESTSIVSHQLKTPLSAIKGYVEVLLAEDLGSLNTKQKEYLRDILENTGEMLGLIRNILDVTRIEAGQLTAKKEKTDLAKLVKEALDEFVLISKAKNCELVFNAQDNLPKVELDASKVKQAISNLISNAIAYNKRKGKVTVSLYQKGKELIFCCEDTGIGISPEEREKIFSKFYRSPRAIVQATGGSGLGLFIAKALIEANGGRIWLESELEKGSKFCFAFPKNNNL